MEMTRWLVGIMGLEIIRGLGCPLKLGGSSVNKRVRATGEEKPVSPLWSGMVPFPLFTLKT